MKIEHHRQIREDFRLSMRSSIQDRGNRSNHHSATPPLPAAVSAFSSQDDHEDRNGTENFQTLAESLAPQLSPRKRAAVNKESGACDPWSDEKTALSCVCRRAWIDDWGRCREEPLVSLHAVLCFQQTCASPAPRARKRKQCHRCVCKLISKWDRGLALRVCLSPSSISCTECGAGLKRDPWRPLNRFPGSFGLYAPVVKRRGTESFEGAVSVNLHSQPADPRVSCVHRISSLRPFHTPSSHIHIGKILNVELNCNCLTVFPTLLA